MLPNVTEHVIQEPYITSEDFCRKIQAAIEEYDKHLTSGQGTKTKEVLPHLKVFSIEDDSTRQSERKNKK